MGFGWARCRVLFENDTPSDVVYLDANEDFGRFTGLRDVVGRRVNELIPGHWEAHPDLLATYARVARTGAPAHLETSVPELGVWLTISLYRPAPDEFAAVVGEISSRKRTEEIRRARLRLMEVAASRPLEDLLVATLDEAEELSGSLIGFYHFLEADQETLRLKAWSTRTTSGACSAEGKDRHYPVSKAGVWADCAREGRPVVHNDYASLPHRQGIPDGHAPVLRELTVPVVRDGRIVAILGVGNKPSDYVTEDVEAVSNLADLAWDIVERKRAESALKDETLRWQTTFDSVEDSVWLLDEEMRVRVANRATKGVLGIEPDSLVGRHCWHAVHGTDQPIPECPVVRAARDQKRHTSTLKVQERWLEVTADPVFDGTGRFSGAVHVVRDVTARVCVEEELRTHRVHLRRLVEARTAELQASNRELESFAYTIAHDLKTPLRSMSGFSSALLLEYPDRLDEQGRRYLERIGNGANRLGEMIDDLLELSRITRTRITRSNVDLGALAAEAFRRLQAIEPGRRVEFRSNGGMVVQGDEGLLRLAMGALVGNAWKFSSNRDESIIEVGTREEAGERVFLVRDNGVGFDMAYAGELFAPFHRLHRLDEFPGEGIGLTLAHRVISRHGGRIWPEATVGEGATFYFTLGGPGS